MCFDLYLCIFVVDFFCIDGKRMDRKTRLMFVATAIALCVVAIYQWNRRRRESITYGPVLERDKHQIYYLNNKIWQCDTKCKDMLRL